MVLSRRTFGLTLAAAIAALTLGSTAQAAPILVKKFDGISGDTGLTVGGSSFTMTFSDNFTTRINGSALGVANWIPTFLNNYVFSKSGVVGNGGTSYALASLVGSPALRVLPTAGQGGGSSNFGLTNLVAFVPDAAKNTMIIKGLTSLLTNGTPNYDFSPFNPGGKYTITFNIDEGDLNQIIGGSSSAPDVSGTSSFSLAPNDVPEPASLAVFGLLTLAGGVIARRKLKRTGVAQA